MGRRPRVLVIPFPAQGHVNPLLHFSGRIANHGIKITFVNTDFNHNRILSAMVHDSNNNPTSSCIDLLSIPDGMGLEEDRNELGKLCDSILATMPRKLEELIQCINDTLEDDDMITCIVADGHMAWVREIAEKLGIRVAVFWPASAALLCVEKGIPTLIDDGLINGDGFSMSKQTIQLSPSMPTTDIADLPWHVGDTTSQRSIFRYIKRFIEDLGQIEWQLSNSTRELEQGAFSLLPKLLPIGPVLESHHQENIGAQFWQEDTTCLKWLDQQPSKSVIYVAFGSFTILDQTQFQELALGLQLTKRPYLWVVRPGTTKEASNLYHEFQGSHGKIATWVPQQKVLSHPAIACFVSHCGWNSTMEGLSNGVPFLCWPYFCDQYLNKSYICDIWSVGMGLDKDENGIITKEEFKGKVEQLLGDGYIFARSLKFKELLRKNNGENGQSLLNINNFIKWLKA